MDTHIISSGIPKDIVESICLWDVLRCFANNNDQLNFVIWEVIFRWLSYFGDDNIG